MDALLLVADEVGAELDLDALYRAHASRVARWVYRFAGPDADVEDLVHEVFVVVDAKRDSFRGESSITTWLYGITYNVVRAQRRRERMRRWIMDRLPFDFRSERIDPTTPIEELERADLARLVYRVLDRIGEKYRTVLILHELEGLDGPEIAELTGIKLATVWVRLHRARALFREAFERERRRAR